MQPFENITVIEFSTMITASFATMMMADQGARVIKVEPVLVGDPMRFLGTSKGGISALFANCNGGKESLRLDLKQAEGVQVARTLVKKADVVIHNYRPGVMDQLGLGSESLRLENPRLVYLAISGFGTQGPLSSAPAYDPIVQAHAGFTAMQGSGSHAFVRSLVCDKITAYNACQAVTAALLVREKTGEGQHIDLSMLDAALFFLFPDGFMNNTLLDNDVEVKPHLAEMYELTRTADGGINIAAANDRQMAGVLSAIGREDLLTDPRFDSMVARMENRHAFQELLETSFSTMSSDEAIARLRGYDVPCAKCLDFEEVIHQPQLQASATVAVHRHPSMGNMRVVRSPVKFEGAPNEPRGDCPGHGEHTRKLLAELGYDAEQIKAMSELSTI